jgi:hypothetical protein
MIAELQKTIAELRADLVSANPDKEAYAQNAIDLRRRLCSAPAVEWIKCADRLPECPHECTTDHAMVSQTLLVADDGDPTSFGMAHMREDGTWKLYGGDFDFMHLERVTHWAPMPKLPSASVAEAVKKCPNDCGSLCRNMVGCTDE